MSPNSSRQPSRKQAQAARKARAEAMRLREKRHRRRQNLLVIGGSIVVAAVVLALVGVSIATRRDHNGKPDLSAKSISPTAPTGTATKAAAGTPDTTHKSDIAGVQFWQGLAHNHVTTPVSYAQTPPVGGPHNPVWLNCGIYNDPVPNENAVYDLARGAVWITYQPTLDTESQNALIKLVKSFKTYVTLSPYPKLPHKVVASAWGTQLALDSAVDPRLKQFVQTYRQGPQTPEKGPCTGGTGEPRGTVQEGDITPPAASTPVVVPTATSSGATAPSTSAKPTATSSP